MDVHGAKLVRTPIRRKTVRSETRKRWWFRVAVAVLLTAFVLVAAITAFGEVVSGMSADWRFVLVAAISGVVPLLLVARLTRSQWVLAICGTWIAVVIASHFSALNPVKPFRQFFAALQVGMTEQQILTKLHERFPVPGRFRVPRESNLPEYQQLSFTLDPTNGNYDSEIVVLIIRDGRLIRKQYLPD